jgi:hypothetical protein
MPDEPAFLTRLGRLVRVGQLSRAYRLCFARQHGGEEVLADLAELCHMHDTGFDPDPYVHARNAGRREVFNHIRSHLHLEDEMLIELYKQRARPIPPQQRIE